jgi:pyruvate dehydrogenase E2 component (dihydrolipoamide acetyltransferase)
MGQGMEEGRVIRWLKSAGDKIEGGQDLVEVETDKSIAVLEASAEGILQIVVPDGETVPVGTVIAVIDDGRPELETASTPSLASAPVPHIGRVKASPVANRLAKEHGIDVSQVMPGDPARFITKSDVEAFVARRETGAAQVPARVNASPVARRLAEERGVDLAQVRGSGPGGRITKHDVEGWLVAQDTVAVPVPEEVRRVPLSKIKQTTARRMVESKVTAPHFYVSTEIEMSSALALRESLKARGHEVSINDLVLRAATLALRKYPVLNATYAGDEIHLFPHINLAVAVALEDGLITPVIHQCEDLSLVELAAAAKALVEHARTGRLRPEEMQGGTFTVTNLGMFGMTSFQAIVNPPQAAILAVGGVRTVPTFDDQGRVVAAPLLTATVSADHRVTDGAEVARFLQELERILEDGFELL